MRSFAAALHPESFTLQALLEREFGEEGLAAEVAARYFSEGPGRRYKFRPQYASEAALCALRARPGLPDELAAEVNRWVAAAQPGRIGSVRF